MVHPLSIIVPHFQKQESLRQVFEEMQLQLIPEDRILVVDDFSPNGVPDFDCSCTKVIHPPQKLTPHIYRLNTLRNVGLQHAPHDPCIILDPDCIPNPHFLDNARKMYDPVVLFSGRIDKTTKDRKLKMDIRSTKRGSRWSQRFTDIYGGCLLFSRDRTKLIGWFDEGFNGVWGAEEHDFASRCYHSGMKLRYAEELYVTHLWHPHISREGYERNRARWVEQSKQYAEHLNHHTPYKPAVGVMVITMLRPDLIDQCLSSVFRNRIPVKVRLAVNGDDSPQTLSKAREWGARWAVDLVEHERKWPARVRSESMAWARDNNFKYHLMIDDDMILMDNTIVELAKALEANPQLYAVSGCMSSSRGNPQRMLGGRMRDGHFYNYPPTIDLVNSDWCSGGLTMHRLEPFVPYDIRYQTGYNDFDWSMTVKSMGLQMATTGQAKAYHGYKLTTEGMVPYKNSNEYRKIRSDHVRHAKMREIFKQKWGLEIGEGGMWRG